MSRSSLDAVLIGGNQRTLKTFRALLDREDVNIEYFIIQIEYDDEPEIHPKLVDLAEQNDIEYFTSPSAKPLPEEQIEHVRSLASDVILRGGNWRAVLPPRFWGTTEYGCIGLHGSLLPEYRGWANINWYLINGESEYGLRMFRFNENIDDGEIVYQESSGEPLEVRMDIDDDRYIREILEEVDERHVEEMMELVDLLIEDDIVFVQQDRSRATWTCHRGPEDGEIDWTQSTDELVNFIRAQSRPYPGAFSFYNNEKFKIWKASEPEDPPEYVGRIPGKVVDRNEETGTVDVLTGDSVLRIEEISVSGEEVDPYEFIDSVRESLGYNPREKINQLEERIEALEDQN
ncbi:methionyl-tRNA formyltransferase [Halosimplex marinum]|uniref:methionyl-tRNA formyltransferase n=1 Tax=Halosimplex marinum TaxID=3396620 RepID=UPI003F567D96